MSEEYRNLVAVLEASVGNPFCDTALFEMFENKISVILLENCLLTTKGYIFSRSNNPLVYTPRVIQIDVFCTLDQARKIKEEIVKILPMGAEATWLVSGVESPYRLFG